MLDPLHYEISEGIRRLARIGELAMMTAHDINNLLSIILVSTQQLELDHGDQTELCGELAGLRQMATRAAHVTREFQLLGSRGRPEVASLPLTDLLDQLAHALALLAGMPVAIERKHRVIARADPALLEQAIMNLVTNARDAARGRGTIEISLDVREWPGGDGATGDHLRAGRYAVIAVADHGAGVPRARVRDLFEPFCTSKARGHGSGLGLTIVREAATSAGGGVLFDERPGGGAVFSILLPEVV